MSKENSINKITSDKNCYRYLFDEMSESEQLEFEEVCFGNDGYVEKLESIREEIIDKYLGNELNLQERKRFEKYFLLSPYHREKLEFSKNLSVAVSEKKSLRHSFINLLQAPFVYFSSLFASPGLAKATAVLASLLVFIGCLWLIMLWFNSQPSITVAENRDNNNQDNIRNTNITPPSLTPTNENENEKSLENNQKSNVNSKSSTDMSEDSSPKTNSSKDDSQDKKDKPKSNKQNNSNSEDSKSPETVPKPKPVLATFIPIPATRSTGNEEPLLIRKGVTSVRFKLDAPIDTSKKYFVWIRTAENREVWKDVNPKIKPGVNEFFIIVPAKVFSNNDYKLEIFEEGNTEESVESYTFRVNKD